MPVQRIYWFDDHILNLTANVEAPTHRHGVMQVSVSLDEHDHAIGESAEELQHGRAFVVASNAPHWFEGHDGVQAIFWVNAASRLGAQLQQRVLGDKPIAALATDDVDLASARELVTAFQEKWDGERVRQRSLRLLGELADVVEPAERAVHPAICRAVRHIGELMPKRISAKDLAAEVGLSESRLLHLFKDELGTPLRAYLMWHRYHDAMVVVLTGKSVTEAAHLAGFADGGHLTRVSTQLTGFNPTAAVGRVQYEPIHAWRPLLS